MAEPTVKVWDGWIRLFHWALVALVAAQYATAELGLMEWHFRCGYTLLALLLFRLAWGVVGSETARFARFVKSPWAALRYLRGAAGHGKELGHNAAGGLMVVLLLSLLLLQVGTGLFANEEPGQSYGAYGPFALEVSTGLSEALTALHAQLFDLLLAAIALHVGAVLVYLLVARRNLVRPMLTGRAPLPPGAEAPRIGHPALAAALLAAAGLAVWALSRLGG
jgi:cytochrome b